MRHAESADPSAQESDPLRPDAATGPGRSGSAREHRSILEGHHHDEGLRDRAAGRLDAKEAADTAAVPGRLGDVGAILRPARPLARSALYRNVEGGPPLPVVAC